MTTEPRTPEAALVDVMVGHTAGDCPDHDMCTAAIGANVARLTAAGWSLVRKTVERHGHWYDGVPGVWASDVDADGYCEQCRPTPTDGDLTAAWRYLEEDALAGDGRITDRDVIDAIRRHRPRIESAAHRSYLADRQAETSTVTVERLARALVRIVEPRKHSQLCPVWGDRASDPVAWDVCDCWVKPGRVTQAEAIIADLAEPTEGRA